MRLCIYVRLMVLPLVGASSQLLSMPSGSLQSVPSMKGKEEPLHSALRSRGPTALVPIVIEIAKQKRLKALGVDVSRAYLAMLCVTED